MTEAGHSIETKAIPGVASAEGGQVILDGPNGVAITMTPDAAEGTARSLLVAAEVAKHQEPGA
ncbi:hypothetical protein [Sphingomonas sp. G-3-2-10]|jgi:hypothetical protein|uniref:hypothetical protein n=1 Tax=Sphingomonas sp. G-3-2-10 TaxID=2728838 RepID=UPI00146AE905|nr:hypothetical protein [Sphingomonas sp. G-3-2-10]NML05281.1 hypothetical protein [Sphingomonas sp. G-3-2-10]